MVNGDSRRSTSPKELFIGKMVIMIVRVLMAMVIKMLVMTTHGIWRGKMVMRMMLMVVIVMVIQQPPHHQHHHKHQDDHIHHGHHQHDDDDDNSGNLEEEDRRRMPSARPLRFSKHLKPSTFLYFRAF